MVNHEKKNTFHILGAMIGHETNVRSRLLTTRSSFIAHTLLKDDEVMERLAKTSLEFSGFSEAAAEYGWEIETPLGAWATPGGRVENDIWEEMSSAILERCQQMKSVGQLDGIMLFLHGAMATEDHDDAEGMLLQEVRRIVGSNIPIAITVDMHANITPLMAENANILTAYRTYPHIDQSDTVMRAARILQQALLGQVTPRLLFKSSGLKNGLDDGRTNLPDSVMMRALAIADRHEKDGVLAISLQPGFSFSNLETAGTTIVVTYDDGCLAEAEKATHELLHFIQETKDQKSFRLIDENEAVDILANAIAKRAGKPVIVADYSDNPGGGAYGDSTILLASLMQENLGKGAIGAFYDPIAVKELAKYEVGDNVEFEIGGKFDVKFGSPMKVTGVVIARSNGRFISNGPRLRGMTVNLGDTVLVRSNLMDIVLCSERMQCSEVETFTHLGLDLFDYDYVIVKSMQHFRAAFEPLAAEVIVVDAGALCSEREL